MKCYDPRLAFVNPEGGRPIFTKYRWKVFINKFNGYRSPHGAKFRKVQGTFVATEPLKMPCQKCEACYLESARQMAVRCYHELKSFGGVGSFLTLTYAPEHLPLDGSYNEEHAVTFVKDLREHLRVQGVFIKTFGVAEYGDRGMRPHFHICIFGYAFPDRTVWTRRGKHGSRLAFRSQTLEKFWKYGNSEFGELNYKSACYTARYVQKKAKRKKLPAHLLKEKAVCVSKRPGIGAEYFKKYFKDFYGLDACEVEGKKQGIPRYYDKLLEKYQPEMYQKVKLDRKLKRPITEYDNTEERLKARKAVHQAQIKKLKRGYEEDEV